MTRQRTNNNKGDDTQAVLANPSEIGAGVVRAIEIVEQALVLYGAPTYVLH
jgi:4-hydroxy-3-methylbut-2-enyl diphosphate reductase IspH